MRNHYYIKYTVLLFLTILISCQNKKHDNQWTYDVNGVKIWINIDENDFEYLWDGEIFDSIAHGEGVFKILQNDSVIEEKKTNAFYGSINPHDIVSVGNNEKYIGTLSGDKFNGYGVYVKGNDIYVGSFKDSKPDGFLSLYKNGNLYYTGLWSEGKFNGEGTLYKEDGSIKTGDWENGNLVQTEVDVQLPEGHYKGYVKYNLPDGIGTMVYQDSSQYSGKWKNGLWDGEGLYTTLSDTISSSWIKGLLDGNTYIHNPYFKYEGTYMEGNPHGYGVLSVPGSQIYSGFFNDGERDGYGELTLANGDSYKGDWGNGLFNGDGQYIYKNDMAFYDGQWYDGLQDGIGYYRCHAFAYRGEWEDGWINGYGKMVFSNKDQYIGNFVENKFYGEGFYLYANGNCYEGEFVDGKFNGLGTFTFSNGDTYTGEFKDGQIFGDGTLIFYENREPIVITAQWDGKNKFPTNGSIIFANGDVYEGTLVNGMPTEDGRWTTLENIEKNISWTEKANDFYKSHKEEFEKISTTITHVAIGVGVAAAITGVAVAVVTTGGAAAPAALVAINGALGTASTVLTTTNTVIYATEISASTASASIDYKNATSEEEKKEIIKTTGINLAIDAAFMVVPKVAKTSAARAARAALSKGIKDIGRKTVVSLNKNKAFGKIITVVKDKNGTLSKQLTSGSKKSVKSSIDKGKEKFESLLLKQLIKKTKLYKRLLEIQAKGPIVLSPKTISDLRANKVRGRDWLKNIIEVHTGNKNNFQEFFIRLSMSDKKLVKEIMGNQDIREYVDKCIRAPGGVHEWLMTKNFTSFLTDSKWGEDGPFLALALKELVQETKKIKFKIGGGHGTTNSGTFHNKLSKVISECNSKEELFVKVRKFAKAELTEEAYNDFNIRFKKVFMIKK